MFLRKLLTFEHSLRANFTALVPSVIIIATSVLLGCVLYAYFELCFPLFTGEVSKADQLLPLMAVRVLGKIPGLTGLFMSGLYAGALRLVVLTSLHVIKTAFLLKNYWANKQWNIHLKNLQLCCFIMEWLNDLFLVFFE